MNMNTLDKQINEYIYIYLFILYMFSKIEKIENYSKGVGAAPVQSRKACEKV